MTLAQPSLHEQGLLRLVSKVIKKSARHDIIYIYIYIFYLNRFTHLKKFNHRIDKTNAQDESKTRHTQYFTVKNIHFTNKQIFMKIQLNFKMLAKPHHAFFWLGNRVFQPIPLESQCPHHIFFSSQFQVLYALELILLAITSPKNALVFTFS